MSTEGNAQICIVSVLGGVAQAGVLLQKGAILLGDQLVNSYIAECRKWTNLFEAVHAESAAQVDQINGYLTTRLLRAALSRQEQNRAASTIQARERQEQQELHAAIVEARRAIDNSKQIEHIQIDMERTLAYTQLASAIEIGQDVLPAATIVQAEAALDTSVEAMHKACDELELAWQQVTTSQAHEKQRRQVHQLLQTITGQLAGLARLVKDTPAPYQRTFAAQQKKIQALSDLSRKTLERQPDEALRLAQEAQQQAQTLSQTVTEEVLQGWDTVRSEINVQQGTLSTLKNLLSEAATVSLVKTQETAELNSRIDAMHDELEDLVECTLPVVHAQLPLLQERSTLLKQEVFTLIQTQQQQSIANTIATTMTELGFLSAHGSEPATQENGDMVRIETMRTKGSGLERDDKIVSFDIGRDGAVTYDFSGYTGDECVREAEKIFAALQLKGLFLLDKSAAHHLQDYPVERITPELLNQRHLQPHLIVNKTQTRLAERLQMVLQGMHFENIKQQSIGGCIELEAFNGPLGYRVVLSPQGEAQVFKDGAILTSTADLIVAETQNMQDQPESPAVEQETQMEPFYLNQEENLLENQEGTQWRR